MAVAVIGGLITSTVLSLLVVPAVFTYVDDFEQWLRRHSTSGGAHGTKRQQGAAAIAALTLPKGCAEAHASFTQRRTLPRSMAQVSGPPLHEHRQ
jgi:predicted RND superfamily exporter protein